MTPECANKTRETCSNIENGVVEIRNSQSSSASNSSAEHKSIQDAISILRQDIRIGIDSLPSNVRNALESSLSTTIQQMLSPMLEQNFQALRSQIEEKALMQHESLYQQQDTTQRYELGDSERAKDSSLEKRNGSRSKKRFRTMWRSLQTPIGIISHSRYIVYPNRISGAALDEDTSEFRLVFIPRSFLFKRATSITGIWDPASSYRLTDLNFHFRTVLSDDSPIFKACKAGDIGTMKFLIQNKQASFNAVNTRGEGLLMVRALSRGASQRTNF